MSGFFYAHLFNTLNLDWKISIKLDNLRKTLAAIDRQDYPNIEVCIADSASTDGTLDVIMEYAKRNEESEAVGFAGVDNVGSTEQGIATRSVVWSSEKGGVAV